MNQLILEMTKFFSGDPEQIQHFIKVHSFARLIGQTEGLDEKTQKILELAAIVHDIGIKPSIEKYGSGNGKNQELEGPPVAAKMLKALEYPQDVIDRVCYLVGHHHTYSNIDGMDYQILVEADFLVNMYEAQMSGEAIKSTLEKIFRTKMGIEYCTTMFNVK